MNENVTHVIDVLADYQKYLSTRIDMSNDDLSMIIEEIRDELKFNIEVNHNFVGHSSVPILNYKN